MLVSVKALKAASLCVADSNEIRTYLWDVFVDGHVVVGTNGHIGFVDKVGENNDPDTFSTRIPVSIIEEFLKKNKLKDGYIDLVKISDDTAALKFGEDEISFEIQGYYVDYERFLNPNRNIDAVEKIQINTNYLEILHKVNKIIRDSKFIQPILNFTGHNQMFFASWESRLDSHFYVMPCKIK